MLYDNGYSFLNEGKRNTGMYKRKVNEPIWIAILDPILRIRREANGLETPSESEVTEII